MDGGDGIASVTLGDAEALVVKQMAARTASRRDIDPPTGAELGMGLQGAPVNVADGTDVDSNDMGSVGKPVL